MSESLTHSLTHTRSRRPKSSSHSNFHITCRYFAAHQRWRTTAHWLNGYCTMPPRKMFSLSKPTWNSTTLAGQGGRGATEALRKQLWRTFSHSAKVSGIALLYLRTEPWHAVVGEHRGRNTNPTRAPSRARTRAVLHPHSEIKEEMLRPAAWTAVSSSVGSQSCLR